MGENVIHICLVFLAALMMADSHAEMPASSTDWVVSVILPKPAAINTKKFEEAFRKKIDTKDELVGFEGDKDVLLVRVAGGTAMISHMDVAIPKGELQRVCTFAWYWKAACNTVNDHRAHYLVILMGTKLSKLDSALLQTKLVAAALESSDAVAVYWGTNLQSREVFLKGSTDLAREQPPASLWVGQRLSREQSGNFTMSTDGLKSFGLMEIETKDAPVDGVKLVSLIVSTAQYLIRKGAVIRDGDTIGESAAQRIRVRHKESLWNDRETVYRVEFEK